MFGESSARIPNLRFAHSQLYEILEQAPFPIMVHSVSGVVVFVNSCWARTSGYTAVETPTVQHWIDVAVRGVPENENHDGGLHSQRTRILTKHGEERIWDMHTCRIGPPETTSDLIARFVVDLTDQLNAERELIESHRFLDTVFEHLPNMIFVKEAKDLRFVQLNRAGEELLGYDREELIGKNDFDFFSKRQAEFFVQKDRKVLESGELEDIPEETIDTKHLGVRILHTRKVPVYDDEGEPSLLLGISEDITEKRVAQRALKVANRELEERVAERTRELKKANEELQRRNRELDELNFASSNGLKIPLRQLAASLESALSGGAASLDEFTRRELETSCATAIKLHSLIDRLLELSRLGRIPADCRSVAVNRVIDEVLKYCSKEIEVAGAEILRRHVPRVIGDEAMLRQLYQNLVENALKFRSEEAPVVEFTAQEKGDEVVLGVRDNGIGISSEDQQLVFSPFERLSSADQNKGTGMGLAICARIMERLGGEIWVDSAPGKGSHFQFSLRIDR